MYRLTSNMYTYICKRTHIPDADLVKFWLFAPAKRWTLEFDIKHPPKDEETKDFKIEISLSGACSGLVLSSQLDIMDESTKVETTTFTTKQIGQTVPSPARLLTHRPLFFRAQTDLT